MSLELVSRLYDHAENADLPESVRQDCSRAAYLLAPAVLRVRDFPPDLAAFLKAPDYQAAVKATR